MHPQTPTDWYSEARAYSGGLFPFLCTISGARLKFSASLENYFGKFKVCRRDLVKLVQEKWSLAVRTSRCVCPEKRLNEK